MPSRAGYIFFRIQNYVLLLFSGYTSQTHEPGHSMLRNQAKLLKGTAYEYEKKHHLG